MAKVFIRPDGTIEGLHTDIVPLQTLGRLNVTRATNVEFDSERQQWVVSLPNGTELYSHPNREVALKWEREYCENALLSGYRVKEA
jgi:hypothetical protein